MRNKRNAFTRKGSPAILLAFVCAVLLCGCSPEGRSDGESESADRIWEESGNIDAALEPSRDAAASDAVGASAPEREETEQEASSGEASVSGEEQQEAPPANGYRIVLDAGHQQHGNSDPEPIGPGASEMKAKVSGGTHGNTSGLYEYELTLMVAEKLQEQLEERGYEVVMVRTSHDVDISNSERAQVANDLPADAFIRIHADGSEDPNAKGAMTICQTPGNPYNGDLYEESRALSDCVLEELTAATGCNRRKVWETDTMSGINWCQVPVTIVEMGFMTNPEEDALMATEEYQDKIAEGIANGIDRYLEP